MDALHDLLVAIGLDVVVSHVSLRRNVSGVVLVSAVIGAGHGFAALALPPDDFVFDAAGSLG